MEQMKFCQSCAMPLEASEQHGINADGSKNEDYCMYCYQQGAFTKEESMEEMIETCIPFLLENHPKMTAEVARSQMQAFFPQLKRWNTRV